MLYANYFPKLIYQKILQVLWSLVSWWPLHLWDNLNAGIPEELHGSHQELARQPGRKFWLAARFGSKPFLAACGLLAGSQFWLVAIFWLQPIFGCQPLYSHKNDWTNLKLALPLGPSRSSFLQPWTICNIHEICNIQDMNDLQNTCVWPHPCHMADPFNPILDENL